MKLQKYIEKLPSDLNLTSATEEVKLLKLYVYHAYCGADPLKTDDVNSGCTYTRESQYGIDGVFINETLEEDTLECIYSYYVGENEFRRSDVLNALNHISSQIENVYKRRAFGTNKKAEDLLDKYKNDYEGDEKMRIIIRVITDYQCDEKEKYEIAKKVEQYDVSIPGFNVSSAISFGDDIIKEAEANTEPFDYVSEGKLEVDTAKNILYYDKNSFVCNISAMSLKDLWHKEGGRGLLAMNLRYYIKDKNIDPKIEDSVLYSPKEFWYLNNGIIIVCNDFSFKDNELRLKEFSIVNGGQTSRMIGTIPFEKDFYITCKVVKNTFKKTEDKNLFVSKVAEASNTQKPIKKKDIIANRIEQRDLKSRLQNLNIFVEIKRGEKYDHVLYKEPWQKTKNNEIAQMLHSFVYMEPGPARNNVSKILQNQEKYDTIFKHHKYSDGFIHDLIFLDKAYLEYKKKIIKDKSTDAIKVGLVSNGLYYCLAIIGYMLKIIYNKEFANDMRKYRHTAGLFDLYSSELAFSHHFISKKTTYKEFKENVFDLFDFILSTYMIQQFNRERCNNPSLSYSNWTKTNTGFDAIRADINTVYFNNNNKVHIDTVKKYFVEPTQEIFDKNSDTYINYCKSNKKITAKDSSGNNLSEHDTELRNQLMVYRMKRSHISHIPENKIFTDKMLDKIIINKPININELKKIVSPTTAYYCGKDILKIIEKYI